MTYLHDVYRSLALIARTEGGIVQALYESRTREIDNTYHLEPDNTKSSSSSLHSANGFLGRKSNGGLLTHEALCSISYAMDKLNLTAREVLVYIYAQVKTCTHTRILSIYFSMYLAREENRKREGYNVI
jgi:hypothetical protein